MSRSTCAIESEICEPPKPRFRIAMPGNDRWRSQSLMLELPTKRMPPSAKGRSWSSAEKAAISSTHPPVWARAAWGRHSAQSAIASSQASGRACGMGLLGGEAGPTPAAASAPAERVVRGLPDRRSVGRDLLLLELAPVRDGVRTIAMNLEPRQRLREGGPVEHAALRARGRVDFRQPLLDRQDLVQPFDVPPRDRQQPQLDPALERIGGETGAAADEAEGEEQRAREDRVRQGVGSGRA